MKKLFTLLVLLVAIVTGAKAADNVAYIGGIASGTTANIDLALTTGETREITVCSKGTNTNSITYDTDCDVQVTSAGGTSMGSTSDLGANLVTKGKSYVKTKVNEGDQVYIYFYHTSTFPNKNMTVSHGEKTKIADVTINNPTSKVGHKVLWTATLTDDVYFSFNNSLYVYAIKIIPVVKGPEITDQTIADANYMQGQTTGVAALSVTAQASNANNSLEYQWYSNTTNSTEGGTAIATGTSYTPDVSAKGVTYYYCVVTEKDGDSQVVGDPVASNIAKITVSAAEAPTIQVSGAPSGDVKVGTVVTLTASATGTPTPTITWYNGNDESVATIEGTQLAYTVPTSEADTYTFYAVASNGVGTDATSATQTIVVKEQVATPTITPNGAYFDGEQEVTLACTTDGATIQYSTDGGSTWENYDAEAGLKFYATTTLQAKATYAGMIDSEVATATFTKVELVDQTDVTAATTWDWSTVTNSSSVDFSGTSLNNADVLFANIEACGQTAVTGLGNETALLFNGQRAYNNANGSKHCQGNYLKFNTTIPGIVTVEYANTGGNAARTVNVNGQKGSKSVDNNSTYQSESFNVEAGEVLIKGVQVSDDADKMLRIRKIVFTPTVPVTITSAGAASFSSTEALDFSAVEGITAYKATAKSDSYVHLDEVAQVPAGAGVIVKGAEGIYNVPVATGDVAELEGNLLVGTGENTFTVTSAEYGKVFKYVKTNAGVVGFQKAKEGWKCQVGHAYLKFSETSAREFIGIFGEEVVTGIDAIENGTIDNDAPAYNLAGQKVGKGYKGIVIINGKKVVK